MKTILTICIGVCLVLSAEVEANQEDVWMPHLCPEEIRLLLPELTLLDNLTAIDMGGCEREEVLAILDTLGRMKQLRAINLENCRLLVFPQRLVDFSQLRQLNLSGNQLKQLPPEAFLTLPLLEMLDLSDNQLQALPKEVASLKHLASLDLRGNQLDNLPPEMGVLATLSQIDISWNRFHSFPQLLFQMPGLRCLHAVPNPFEPPVNQEKLAALSDCKGGRLGLPVKPPQAPWLAPAQQKDKMEAKATLLLKLIQAVAVEGCDIALKEEDVVRHEMKQNMDRMERRTESRLTLFNYLLGCPKSETPTPVDDIFNKFKAYAPDHWISLASPEPVKPVNPQWSIEDHQRRVFEWQLFSTKVIFWMVILIVTTGLILSGVQFYISYRMPARTGQSRLDNRQNPDAASIDRTEIEISLQSIKVQSSVLGIVILAIAIAFFYLYLKFIYPLTPVFVS